MKGMALTLIVVLATLASGVAIAQSTPETKSAPVAGQSSPTPSATDPGQHAFAIHCSRCHNAPEQLNPRMTGTVLRHMRVRAILSAAEERALLRFFNP